MAEKVFILIAYQAYEGGDEIIGVYKDKAKADKRAIRLRVERERFLKSLNDGDGWMDKKWSQWVHRDGFSVASYTVKQ